MYTTKGMRLELCIRLGFLLGALVLTTGAGAQQTNTTQAGSDGQDKITALEESLAQNWTQLLQYTWTETTELSVKGEVKKKEQKECHYDRDGRVRKTLFQSDASPEPQTKEMKEYFAKAAAVIRAYVPPDPEKIQAAAEAGNVSSQPTSTKGMAAITIKNYLKPGDLLTLGFDSDAKQLRSFQVQSYIDKPRDDALLMSVTFDSLPDGTNYPQHTVLNVIGKKLLVKVTNSEYAKTEQ